MSLSGTIAQIYDVLFLYRRADEMLTQTAQRLAAERDKAAALLTDAQLIIADYQRSHQLEYGCEVDPCDNCQLAAAWLATYERIGVVVPVETPPSE